MKIAVVSGAITEMGFPIVNDLLKEDYLVVLLGLDVRTKANWTNLFSGRKLLFVERSGIDVMDWEKVLTVVMNVCAKMEMVERIDLLINLSKPDGEGDIENANSYALDYALQHSIYTAFNGISELRPLLENSNLAGIFNVYPEFSDRPKKDFVNSIVKVSMDVMSECLAHSLKDTNIYSTSICYTEYNSDQLNINKAIKDIRDSQDLSNNGLIMMIDVDGSVVKQSSKTLELVSR